MGLRTINFSAGQITDGFASGASGDNTLIADGMVFTITAQGNWAANFDLGRFNFAEDTNFGGQQFKIVLTQADGRTFNFKDILFSASLSPRLAGSWAANVDLGGLLVPDNSLHGTGGAWTYSYLFPNGPLPQAGQSLTIRDVPAYSASTPNPNPNPTTYIWFDDLIIDTRPGINSITRNGAATTNANSVSYTVTFSDPVTGVDLSDFTLGTTGNVSGTLSGISGSGSTYIVTVNNIAGSGNMKLNIKGSGTGIADLGGSLLPFGFSSGDAYTIDKTPPAAPSTPTLQVGSDSNNPSDNITNVTRPVVTGTAEGLSTVNLYSNAGATLLGTTTAAANGAWTITANTLANGPHTLTATATDAAGNVSTASSGLQVQIDTTAPSLTSIVRTGNAAVTSGPLSYTVNFSESVSGVDVSNFVLSSTGSATGTITGVSGSGGTYTATVNQVSGDGTLRLDLKSSGTGIVDTAGNAVPGGFTGGQAYTLDTTAPSVASIVRVGNATAISGPLSYIVSFSEAVSGVDTSDFVLNTLSGNAGGTITGISGSGGTYTVTVNNLSGDGALRLDLKPTGTGITDGAGNAIPSGFTGGQTYSIDTTVPTVSSIVRVGNETATSGPLTYMVTFAEAVTGVDSSDFVLFSTGNAIGTITGISGSGTSYTVTVDQISGDGTLRLDLKSTGAAITDAAGNAVAGGFTGGQTYSVDTMAPSIASIVRVGNNTPTSGPLTYTVTFTEAVTGVDVSDFTLFATGTAAGTITGISGSGTTYTLTVGQVAGNGTLRLDLKASGTGITDGPGNAAQAGFTNGQTFTIDTTPPAAPARPTLTDASDSGVKGDTITSTTTPTINGTAEVGSTVTLYGTDGTTVLGTAVATDGTWSITTVALSSGAHSIKAIARDAAGNISTPSAALELTIDTTSPTTATVSPSVPTIESATQTFELTVTFNEAMDQSVSPTISFTQDISSTLTNPSGNWLNTTTYRASYTVVDAEVAVANIGATVSGARDLAGNVVLPSTLPSVFNVATAEPPAITGITTTAAPGPYGIGTSVNFSVHFDRPTTVDVEGGSFIALLSNGKQIVLAATDIANVTSLSADYVVTAGDTDAATLSVVSVGPSSGATVTLRSVAAAVEQVLNAAHSVNFTFAGVSIDANAPTGSAVTLVSDSGISPTDGITNVTTPVFSGTAEAGSVVSLFVDVNNNGIFDAGETLVSAITATDGTWSITASSALADGVYDIRAQYADAANNKTVSNALSLTIDSTPPVAVADAHTVLLMAPGSISNVLANDTGAALVSAVNGNASGVGNAIAGTQGGVFTIAADGSVAFNPGSDFDVLTSGETRDTEVNLTVADSAGNTASSVLRLTVTGKNDAPVLAVNQPISVIAGNPVVIANTVLRATDIDDAPSGIVFTLTKLPLAGTVQRDGTALVLGDTFTQADIDGGKVRYIASSQSGPQSFEVSVSDGGEDGAAPITGLTVAISVADVPVTPTGPGAGTTTTIGGVPVTTQVSTQPDGSQTQVITVPVVTSTTNNAPVDVPLVKNQDGSSALSVAVPAGYGITVSGSTAPTTGTMSSSQFATQLNAHATGNTGDQAGLIQAGTQFLQGLPPNTPVLVQTVVPTLQPGMGTPANPLVISGGTGSTVTALVIDTRGLPPNTTIELQNVSFAAVVGDVTIRGGTGSQTVHGDSGSQNIMLGPDDDILYGGGGDDIIGSAEGNDRIFGEAGNDVVFGGTGADFLHGGTGRDTARYDGASSRYVITQEHAVFTIRSLDDPTDIDTVVNVEALQFSDKTIQLTYSDSISQLSALYKQLFGRQGDLGGIQYWAGELAKGGSAGTIVMKFFDSPESRAQGFTQFGPSGEITLELLYEVMFKRKSDDGGMTYWKQQVAGGMTLTEVANHFAFSTEMQKDHYLAPTNWDFGV